MARLVITGGTGTLGTALIDQVFTNMSLGDQEFDEIVIFSRNEASQYTIKKTYGDLVTCVIGDVRDFEALYRLFKVNDFVIHAAAIKHIDIAEKNPEEAIKTNVTGAITVANAAGRKGASRLVAISTDKACNPNSTYGSTKLLAEKVFETSNLNHQTLFSNARFGNILGSSGSVFNYWKQLLQENKRLTVTDPEMTRYFIEREAAARFVLDVFKVQQGGETFIPNLISYKIDDIASFLSNGEPRDYIGLRLGEKLHEELVNESEVRHTVRVGDIHIIEPLDLNGTYSRPINCSLISQPLSSRSFSTFEEFSDLSNVYAATPSDMKRFLESV